MKGIARCITIVAAALLFALATSHAQGAAQRDTLSHTIAKRDDWVRVRVSRRELRAEFHTDTTLGWAAQSDRDHHSAYIWSLYVAGMDGPRVLMVQRFREERGPREFASLASVVAGAQTVQCTPGMIDYGCVDTVMSARVKGDAVVLVLRDSTRIARLFGMRPEFVQAREDRPQLKEARSIARVRVQYVEPKIPEPSAATRADAARSKRRYQASVSTISRFIHAFGGRDGLPLWLAAGDSTPVVVSELHCAEDACMVDSFAKVADSGWSVDDARIARLLPPARDPANETFERSFGSLWYVKALQPGKTIIRVYGLRGPSDTALSSSPPKREVEKEVIVTLPVARVAITPRPDTVRLGQRLSLTTQVFDSTSHTLEDVPLSLDVEGGGNFLTTSSAPVDVELKTPGRKRIVVRVAALAWRTPPRQRADTLFVTVVDSAAASPKR